MLLDTHVWVWAVDGSRKLGTRTRRRLQKTSGVTDAGGVCVSTASVFEITALHTAGRLHLTMPVERWIRDSVALGGLRVLDLDIDVAVDAGCVPATALADPIDRWLVATARAYQLPLVTADRRILDYAAKTKLVRVIDASA